MRRDHFVKVTAGRESHLSKEGDRGRRGAGGGQGMGTEQGDEKRKRRGEEEEEGGVEEADETYAISNKYVITGHNEW